MGGSRLTVTSFVGDAYQYYIQHKDQFNSSITEDSIKGFVQKYINEPAPDTKNRLPTLSDVNLVGLKHQDWSPEQIKTNAESTISFEEGLRYYVSYCESVRGRRQVKLDELTPPVPEAPVMCSYFKSKFTFPTENTSDITVPGISMTVKKVLDPDTLIACDAVPDGECHKIRLAGADGEETYQGNKAKREYPAKLEFIATFVKKQNPDLALKLSNIKLGRAMEGAISAATEYRGKLGTLLLEHFTSYYGGHIEAEPSYASDGHLEGLCVFGRFLGWIKVGSVSNYLTDEQKGLPALSSGQMKELYTNMRATGEAELAKVDFNKFGLTVEDQALVKDLFMSYFIDPVQVFGSVKSKEMAAQWETLLKELKTKTGVDYSTNFNFFEIFVGLADSTETGFPNIRGAAVTRAQEIAEKNHYGRHASKMFYGETKECRQFRISNNILTSLINKVLIAHNIEPMSEGRIEEMLSAYNNDPRERQGTDFLENIGVQRRKDKLSKCENIKNKNDEDCRWRKANPLFESAKTSTSQVEAARFYAQVVRYLNPSSPSFTKEDAGKMAFALKKIYFGDPPLFEARPNGTPNGIPPHEFHRILFKQRINRQGRDEYCGEETDSGCYGHDMDTPNVSQLVSTTCYGKISGFYGPARLSGIDAPEIGDVPDTPEVKEWALQLYRKDPNPTKPRKPYVNIKQVKNAIKVLKVFAANPDAIPDDEKFALIRVIATRLEYLALVGWGISEDFLGLVDKEEKNYQSHYKKDYDSGFVHSISMTTRFLYPGEPAWTCGEKQIYDDAGRALEFPVIADPQFIYDYINTKLIADIKSNDEEFGFYKIYSNRVRGRLRALEGSTNEDVRNLAKILDPSTMPTPDDLYTTEEVKKLAELQIKHFTEHPELAEDYEGSISSFYARAGCVWGFGGFRIQDYTVIIAEPEKDAAENGLGFYSDPTFKAIWQYNQKYSNPDCMTGEQ